MMADDGKVKKACKLKFEKGIDLEVLQQNGDDFIFTGNEIYDEKEAEYSTV